MNDDFKASLAEFLGTFTLIFIGAGAGAVGEAGLVGVALAHGLAVMTSIYAWGAISGCHINPAVTLGLLAGGQIKAPKAALYIVAQILGGIAAAFVLKVVMTEYQSVANDTGQLTLNLGETVGALTKSAPMLTILVEALLTFFLVTAVYGSAVAGRNGNAVGLAIGLVVAMDILMGGPLTGASMNPARTIGPWLASGHYNPFEKGDYLYMYLAGPIIGGVVAGVLQRVLFLPEKRS